MSTRALIAVVSALVVALVVATVFVPAPRVQLVLVGSLIALISSLIVSFVQHYLRRSGKLHRDIRAWTAASETSLGARRVFVMRILNEKDVGTALWNLKVAFYKDGEESHTETPMESVRETASKRLVDQIELPPQVTVTKILSLELHNGSTNLEKARDADAIKLVADIPGGSVFKEKLPSWRSEPVA